MCNQKCSVKKYDNELKRGAFWAVLLLLVGMILGGFISLARADDGGTNSDYFKRMERYREQVAGEVGRKHQLDLVQAREAVIDKRLELQRDIQVINVDNSSASYSSQRTKNVIHQENSNNA